MAFGRCEGYPNLLYFINSPTSLRSIVYGQLHHERELQYADVRAAEVPEICRSQGHFPSPYASLVSLGGTQWDPPAMTSAVA